MKLVILTSIYASRQAVAWKKKVVAVWDRKIKAGDLTPIFFN